MDVAPRRFRSPLARALGPVLGGLVVLVALAGLTWAMAAFISSGSAETSERLAPRQLFLGAAVNRAADVERGGPLLFPGLNTSRGERSLVLDHTGDDHTRGWIVYAAHPADRGPQCGIDQVRGTKEFIDCEGRRLMVSDLAPPERGVFPIVQDQVRLVLDLGGPDPAAD